MKKVLFFSILFCAIALPALGELTEADLNKIRLIVNEEIKPIEVDIVLLKTDTAWIRGKLESVDEQFEGVNNQITHSRRITYGLIALIVAAVGIPQIVIAWRSKKDSTQEKQIEKLRQEIEELRQQPVFSTGAEL
ncbi:MAG: hypothetical protein OXD49_10175 [Candidatus Poribacteria bacterium]|nr:hypothetical protein [Candidatus Poribacteria bacterium]